VAALVAVTMLIAGCGSSSSLSHAQLAANATAACRQADGSAARLALPGVGYAGLKRYASQLSPIVDRLIDRLGALNANQSDKPMLERYVGALRTGDRGLALLARASSPAQVSQASSVVSSASIPALAGALGAPACGGDISSLS
jgi:hypothetical protein